ncbi:P-loop containing nucleoside triphosphate hydrolase protein [Mycena filopes]|nr:P-loop containing nucleoside triphosphate hydrolase protein [Mycena filopes]
MGAPTETNPKPTLESEEDASAQKNEYTKLELGVWSVLLPNDVVSGGLFSATVSRWNTIAFAYPIVSRFFREIYALSPRLVILMLLLNLWEELEFVVMLYVAGRLLRIIEVGLKEGRPDVNAIAQALVARLAAGTITVIVRWGREYTKPLLESRIQRHFEHHLLRATLRLDMPTATDTSTRTQATAADASCAFESLCKASMRVFRLATELLFISQQSSAGPIFTLIALVQPILSLVGERTLWLKRYLRMQSLQSMSALHYRGDIIAGDIAAWITAEYQRACDALGTLSSTSVWSQYGMDRTPFKRILNKWAGELPTLYWAATAMLRPVTSMTSIALVQQYSSALNYSLQMLFWDLSQVGKAITDIKILYETETIKNQIVDGDVEYPRTDRDTKTEFAKGMDIELRNVSFAYLGDKSKESALRDVSFRLPVGSLAVIVGANGSGKSTIIKLLTRMYDCDTGAVLVDGLPIQDYRLAGLRQAQATLTQEHCLYPLTLADNIGLGYAERVDDLDMVMEAAKDGGAAGLLEKLKEGAGTTLEPIATAFGNQLDDEKHKGLKGALTKLEKTTEVSGGEKQRLVASRTFMRFRTGKVKLLCVDEPSSALDARGEFELFERLRETAAGKTMIFVTHRFGHLTKYADVIICMKEGKVAELGTHKELMALAGEYASLYNVQAQAFTAEAEPPKETEGGERK